ncbi:cyclic nucleotide-binding domain-containing protein [Actinomadura welshii]
MDEYTRHHDPDQIVPPGTDALEGVKPPQVHDTPAECRDAVCPHQGRPVEPPPRQGFWGSLTDAERAALLASAEAVAYPIGTVLWSEGQIADQAIVIRSGSVRVSVEQGGRERIIAFRGPGDIVGERAALLLRRRSATIVAMDTVHALRMTTQQFVTYLSDHPRVVAVMEREVYDRLTEQAPPTVPPGGHLPAPSPPPNAPGASPYATTAPPEGFAAQPYAAAGAYGAAPVQASAASMAPERLGWAVPGVQDVHAGQPYTAAVGAVEGYPAAMPAYPSVGSVPANGLGHVVQGGWPLHPAAAAQVPPHAQAMQPRALPAWAGQNCTIVYTDIAGFSAAHRNDVDRLDMRRAMYGVLREAFEESGVSWEACHTEDRGDGALIVIPPEVPTAVIVDPVLAALAVRLRRHNQRSSGAVRIQLRVAVDVGPVMPDPPGVAGFVLIHTARLVDARPLKERLAVTGADLGFIASQFVYESVIAHGAGYVNPADYEPISCRVKKLKTEGWIHLRGVPARSAV